MERIKTIATRDLTKSVKVMGCGTAEGTQRFKVAVWKKVDGGAEYVTDSTYYIHTTMYQKGLIRISKQ